MAANLGARFPEEPGHRTIAGLRGRRRGKMDTGIGCACRRREIGVLQRERLQPVRASQLQPSIKQMHLVLHKRTAAPLGYSSLRILRWVGQQKMAAEVFVLEFVPRINGLMPPELPI